MHKIGINTEIIGSQKAGGFQGSEVVDHVHSIQFHVAFVKGIKSSKKSSVSGLNCCFVVVKEFKKVTKQFRSESHHMQSYRKWAGFKQ